MKVFQSEFSLLYITKVLSITVAQYFDDGNFDELDEIYVTVW